MADNDVKQETQAMSGAEGSKTDIDASTKPDAAGAVESARGAEESTKTDQAKSPPASQSGKQRSKSGRSITSGIAFVNATFNNTKVTITDLNGNTLCWSSGGKMGMKGSRKSTAYAAQQVATDAARRAQTFGMREVEVRVKGPGAGRESAVRGIAATGLDITALKDVTPVPHNGCRPPKRRRV